ncbi:MAG: efflux RND transporter periplasmic adaptor subunit, partial [Acidobacteria bacterium]|nr:efflux RND transporter periplasmic adaptor subunit [Acidobacteriota bacterium]
MNEREHIVNKLGRGLVACGVIVGVVAIGWILIGKGKAKPPSFLTATIERGTIIQSVATTGTLTAVTTVQVGSQVSGIIATLHADFNDHVTAGQILAALDPTPFEAAVNQNRAQLQRVKIAAVDAQAKLRRQQALYEARLISADQLDSAKALFDQNTAQVTELEAALERGETNLKYSVIRSPIDGVVVSRNYDIGQTVAASFQAPTLFTIAEDLKRMQLTCDVDEADIGQISVGQPVRFSVDSFPEREFLGQVSQIRLAPKTANNVVTYPVIVAVDNRELALLPGMTAEVRVQVALAENALRVPSSALRFRPELLGLQQLTPRRGAGSGANGGTAGNASRPGGFVGSGGRPGS